MCVWRASLSLGILVTMGRALPTECWVKGGPVAAITAPVADFDGDGDLDIATPMFDMPLSWFENLGGDPPAFEEHSVGGGSCGNFAWAQGAHAADIDGDRDIDLLLASQLA